MPRLFSPWSVQNTSFNDNWMFRGSVEVDVMRARYFVSPSELLELKVRAAKLFAGLEGKAHEVDALARQWQPVRDNVLQEKLAPENWRLMHWLAARLITSRAGWPSPTGLAVTRNSLPPARRKIISAW